MRVVRYLPVTLRMFDEDRQPTFHPVALQKGGKSHIPSSDRDSQTKGITKPATAIHEHMAEGTSILAQGTHALQRIAEQGSSLNAVRLLEAPSVRPSQELPTGGFSKKLFAGKPFPFRDVTTPL